MHSSLCGAFSVGLLQRSLEHLQISSRSSYSKCNVYSQLVKERRLFSESITCSTDDQPKITFGNGGLASMIRWYSCAPKATYCSHHAQYSFITKSKSLHVPAQSRSQRHQWLEFIVLMQSSVLCLSNLKILQCRHYSSKKSKSKKKGAAKRDRAADEDESDDDEDRAEGDEDDEDDGDSEETGEVKTWKDLKMNVPSTRIDAVLSAGLGVSRKKIEDAFLNAKLRHNGKKVLKKSKQVQEGDSVDFVRDAKALSKEGGEVMLVMRVEVKRIKEEKTSNDKTPVVLRRWKHLELPREK